MSEKQTNTSIFTIMLVVLQVAFILFKVLGLINWSWVMVFIPMWIELGLGVIFLIIAIVIAVISTKK